MNLYHYYHIYARGDWLPSVAAHCDALRESGLADELAHMRIGVVGEYKAYCDVIEYLEFRLPATKWCVAATAVDGWEQVTLNALGSRVLHMDGLVLYAHTKGAAFPGAHPTLWRQSMTTVCINNWRTAIELMLEGDYDTAGGFLIREKMYEPDVPVFAGVHGVSTVVDMLERASEGKFEYSGEIDEPQPTRERWHYSGNFWWATTDWLRRLPYPCPSNTRWDAEMYIGAAADGSLPKALNLREGSPFTALNVDADDEWPMDDWVDIGGEG